MDAETQAVIDAVGDGIYIVDREGYVTGANRAWVDRVGIPYSRVVGRRVTDVLREYYFSAQCLQNDGASWQMREREYEQAVSLRVLRDKAVVADFFEEGRFLSTGTPIFDENGEVEQVVTVVRDLTIIPDYDAYSDGEREEAPAPGRRDPDMLGDSPEMERIRTLIGEVAPTDATILITGETGVGKEVVASAIQRRSNRSAMPFVKVNCAAIPENLVEAELFGYAEGAFTGAQRGGKPGLLELANHGTILLDEIGEFPLPLQPKLLRAIQERAITRVGGVEPIPIDVRVLAATNQDLPELVAQKKFREDLYYRLNVIPVYLPPLRARGKDVELLAKSFLAEFNAKYNRGKVFTRGALLVLGEHSWPGNIRELRNLVERLTVLGAQREISGALVRRFLQWKGGQETADEPQLTLQEAVDQVERSLIESALLRCGSTYKAARALGTSQSTLVRKARRLGITTGG